MWNSFVNFITKNSSIIAKSLLVVSSIFSALAIGVSGGTLIPALGIGGVVASSLGMFFVNDPSKNQDLIEDNLQKILESNNLSKAKDEEHRLSCQNDFEQLNNKVSQIDNKANIFKEKLNETNEKLTSYIHKNEEDKSIIDQDISTLKTSQRAPRVFSAGPTLFKKPAPQVTAANESNLENPTQGVRK